jgi:hypothetical protein
MAPAPGKIRAASLAVPRSRVAAGHQRRPVARALLAARDTAANEVDAFAFQVVVPPLQPWQRITGNAIFHWTTYTFS